MKVAVWGAGTIGTGLVYRLVTTPFVSELVWINRDFEKIEKQVIDISHGLAFAPTCHSVRARQQSHADREMDSTTDVLVLALGRPVREGQTRNDKYADNVRVLRQAVTPILNRDFGGVVLVITNPVDLIARWVHIETGIPAERVLGLGTVVETARLRSSLGAYLSPKRPAREVWAYAVGTHDPKFVPVASETLAVGDQTPAALRKSLVELAASEVAQGAERVKTKRRSSQHPIVEGAIQVLESIALDKMSMLTVSVLDPESPDRLFYSMPCKIGSVGVQQRFEVPAHDSQEGLAECRRGLRAVLRRDGGELSESKPESES